MQQHVIESRTYEYSNGAGCDWMAQPQVASQPHPQQADNAQEQDKNPFAVSGGLF